jgi:hypothetical protein
MAHEPGAYEPTHHEREIAERRKPERDEPAIRERAHAIWVSEGREVDHWMRARRELELGLDMNTRSD